MNQAQSRGVRHLALALVTPLVVLMAVLVASRDPTAVPMGLFPKPWETVGWLLVATLAGLHRPFRTGKGEPMAGTLGLGALVVAPTTMRLGPLPAALLAGLALIAIELAQIGLSRRGIGRATASPGPGRIFERAAWVVAAVLAAGRLPWHLPPAFDGLGPFVVVPVLYGTVLLATGIALPGLREQGWPWRELVPATLVDLAALNLGVALLLIGLSGGGSWGLVAVLAVALALLGAEAARNAQLRFHSDRKVDHLESLHQAHERILGEVSGMGQIAQQIFTECRNVLPVEWFHFELLGGPGGSWAAKYDSKQVEEGTPRPPARPAMLPGIHKRAEWRIVERVLEIAGQEGEARARLRLWCDPRQMEDEDETLFDRLVPQMASSVDRAHLDREAKLDPLTGVPVRRLLDSRLQAVYRRSCEEGLPMAVILCDIDHFKKVNDTHGHAAGDEALKLVARTLDTQRRDTDLCCRYGGEEFTVLLEKTDGDAALRLADRLRRAVAALELVYDGKPIPLTLSAGVAAFPELHIKTGSELLLLADEALYEAKHRGRNLCLLHCGHGAFRAPTAEL